MFTNAKQQSIFAILFIILICAPFLTANHRLKQPFAWMEVHADQGFDPIQSGQCVMPLGVTQFLSSALHFFIMSDSAIAQVEDESTQKPQINQQASMLARKRVRDFNSLSWLGASLLALFLYFLMMLLVPRRIPSSWKWVLSPLISSLLIASIAAWYENEQLTRYCGEESGWRLDTFLKVFLINWIIVFLIFLVWAIVNYVRQGNRSKALKTQ
ncbi:hypothetical protein FJZ31_11130 [Candidatus Poribacteria bacterium]|nr:hypothetical protein [Candidatus Poribacteria bacterium]